jgi:hypothetical protein
VGETTNDVADIGLGGAVHDAQIFLTHQRFPGKPPDSAHLEIVEAMSSVTTIDAVSHEVSLGLDGLIMAPFRHVN